MKLLLTALGALTLAAAQAQQAPWQRLYTGPEATDPTVLALYTFAPGQEGKDASGHGHDLTLRGQSKYGTPGPVAGGGYLESFAPAKPETERHGAMAKDAGDLSPAGAFTIELWINPKPELSEATFNPMLVDKKYLTYVREGADNNSDYCLFLRKQGPQWQLVAYLGFEQDSAFFTSEAFDLAPDAWRHVAFAYNGAGVGRFWLDGVNIGRTYHPGRGPVRPGPHALLIGDRVGGNYQGFAGRIGQVRLLAGIPSYLMGKLTLTADDGRRVFERFEPGAKVTCTLLNDSGKLAEGIRVAATGEGGGAVAAGVTSLAADALTTFDVTFDTALRPAEYPLRVTVSATIAGQPVTSELTVPVTIAPRQPRRMPVVMWGTAHQPQLLVDFGFTHDIAVHANAAQVWQDGANAMPDSPDGIAARMRGLDQRLRLGLRAVATLGPPHWIEQHAELGPKYRRIDRAGNPTARSNVCGNFPEVQALCRNTGAAVGRTYGQHPAFDACLVHSEVRDGTDLCFHPHDAAKWKAFSGRDVPAQVVSKYGVRYDAIKDFPYDRVVADDHPLLAYYRWFWTEGDGWNGLHTATHEGLQGLVRPGFWTFFDPAVRVPPIWGSGGQVDVISQWTYSYPDPIKLGQATDELFAMADGSGQRVMKMTQVIWYRTQTAPQVPVKEEDRVSWEKEQPDAQFISIAPDHLRIALWSELARPVQGVMYHGWSSLTPDGTHRSYRCTNLQTREALTQLTHDLVQPYGPMLLDVPDTKADVALLESFASLTFGGQATWGWSNGWIADTHLILQYAQLQPRILYDEHVLRDGLDGLKVLVMPGCEVLTRSVVERIKAFQRAGGLVVGDAVLCPAITPDILLPAYTRVGKADVDKAALLKLAAALRTELDQVYQRRLESSDPEVVTRLRRTGETDYVFAINDHRQFGKYVGHHGKVMEEGLPAQATLHLRRTGVTVYDVLARKAVTLPKTPDGVSWPVSFGPGEGRLFAVVPAAIAAVPVAAPAGRLGGKVTLRVTVQAAGRPVPGAVPVDLRLTDPQGRPAEINGYYSARGGQLTVDFEPAANDLPGDWKLTATELFSGRSGTATLRLSR